MTFNNTLLLNLVHRIYTMYKKPVLLLSSGERDQEMNLLWWMPSRSATGGHYAQWPSIDLSEAPNFIMGHSHNTSPTTNCDVLLTVHLSIFILVINQIDAQNLLYNMFISCLYMFRAPCAHRQEVQIVLYNLWYHHTYRWPTRAQVERGLVGMSPLNLCAVRPPTGVMIPEAV
jgi:hypothetical protein